MGLATSKSRDLRWARIAGLRSLYDYDAPNLTLRERLRRLEYAALQAQRGSMTELEWTELEFARQECEALLQLPELDEEAAERERVRQRTGRIRRIVGFYEGQLSRLNRRYWWIPFCFGLGMLGAGLIHCMYFM